MNRTISSSFKDTPSRPTECSIEGCEKPVNARGWCKAHYYRASRYGDPLAVDKRRNPDPRPPKPIKVCSIEGCERKHYGKGWCENHYARWRRTGDTDDSRAVKSDECERFWSKVDKLGDCWLWTDGLNGSGYGSFRLTDGRSVGAHVAAVILDGREVAVGMHVDHVRERGCQFRHCVRPDHLEVVTARENALRIDRGEKCKRGHDRAEHMRERSNGTRYCSECHREQSRRAYRLKHGLPIP